MDQTVGYYDKNAVAWVAGHVNNRFWGATTTFFKEFPSGKILEIGCGGGRDARDYLLDRYDYTGIDASAGMVAEAKKLSPKANFLHGSFYDLKFPKNLFDGFWASASLLHVPKNRIDEVLGNILKVIKPNGVGFITIKQGVGEAIDEDNRLFAYYSIDEFKNVLEKNSYSILESEVKPMGKTTWLIYVVKSRKK